jgi:hypothetical protein
MVSKRCTLLLLLFLFFINYENRIFRSSKFLLFSDDLKMHMKVKLLEDRKMLQKDLDNFYKMVRAKLFKS